MSTTSPPIAVSVSVSVAVAVAVAVASAAPRIVPGTLHNRRAVRGGECGPDPVPPACLLLPEKSVSD